MTRYTRIISSIFFLAVTVRLVCFVGLIGSDDLNYNRSAYTLVAGTAPPTFDHQGTRLGTFLPVALMFKLFGVNEWSSTVPSFFYYIMAFGILVYTTTIYFGKWSGIIAGLLYTFLPLEIFQATILLPDLPSAASIALSGSVLYIVEVKFTNADPAHSQNTPIATARAFGYMFLGGLGLGWAYLIRETALFFVVFVVGYMGYQTLRCKTVRWYWLWFWAGFFTMIAAELGYYYWTTGRLFYRYLSVTTSVRSESVGLLLKKYSYDMSLLEYLSFDRFRVLFYVPDFGFYYFFAFAGVIYGIYKRLTHLWYFIAWFLTMFFLYSFASKSFVMYAPFRSVPRYFLSLSFPSIIIISKYLQEMAHILTLKNKKDLMPFFISFAIPWILVLVINLLWFSVVRLIFLVFIATLGLIIFSNILRTWLRNKISLKYVPVILPALLLYVNLLPGIYMTAKGKSPRKGITCERDIRQLFGFPLTHTIYTDSRTEAILEYFYQYQYNDQILQFDDADINTLKNTYVIANWERVFFLNRVYDTPIPEFLYHPPSEWRRHTKIGGYVNPCLIYEIP